MKDRLHELSHLLWMAPAVVVASLQEIGPSWKEIGTWAAGGAFTVVVFVGGVMFNAQSKVDAGQDLVIGDLSKTIVEQRIAVAGLTATLTSVNDSQRKLQEQLDYERKRREQREDQERSDLRAAQQQPLKK